MIFAETPRLFLRALERSDLPRLTELIGDWDVCRWLTIVPYPYMPEDAGEFFEKQCVHYNSGMPEFFAIEERGSGFIGGVGLHPSRVPDPKPGEIEIGYWLGKPFWGKGLMSEAAKAAVDLGFQRPGIALIASTTDPANEASQNVLRKTGLKYLGIYPRTEPGLRGGRQATRWELGRADYEKSARQI